MMYIKSLVGSGGCLDEGAILLNTARTHTPVLSRCLSICTKCHNITFLMGTSTRCSQLTGAHQYAKNHPQNSNYRTEGITHIPSTTQRKLSGESCLKKSGRGTGLVPGHFSFIKILFFPFYEMYFLFFFLALTILMQCQWHHAATHDTSIIIFSLLALTVFLQLKLEGLCEL